MPAYRPPEVPLPEYTHPVKEKPLLPHKFGFQVPASLRLQALALLHHCLFGFSIHYAQAKHQHPAPCFLHSLHTQFLPKTEWNVRAIEESSYHLLPGKVQIKIILPLLQFYHFLHECPHLLFQQYPIKVHEY